LPLLWVAVAVTWLLVGENLVDAPGDPGVRDLVLGMFLLNHVVPGTVAVLGVTWTLVWQVTFYCFAAATIPLLRHRPWLAPAIGAAVLSTLMSLTSVPGSDPTGQLRLIVTFVPIIFIGQIIGLTRSGHVTPLAGVALGCVHMWLGLRAVVSWPGAHQGEFYARTLVLLVLVLILLTRANGRAARSRTLALIARRTYGIYLLHIPLVLGTLTLTADRIGFHAALALSLVVLAAGVELAHRFLDAPIASVYRRLESAANAPGRGARLRVGSRGSDHGLARAECAGQPDALSTHDEGGSRR
jgi:peptidoglycan/LPS O-acetylase OafA/YrhL